MAGIGSIGRQKCSDMRHRITIQSPTVTLDAAGQPNVTWANFVVNEPAKFTATNGVESMRGRQLEARVTGVFVIRYRDGLNTRMRISHGGIYYGILHINPVDGLDIYREIMVATS